MEANLKVTLDWRAVLAREIAADPRGKAGIAERMGVSRTLVSLVSAEKYRANTDNFARRVLDLESDIDCPATGARAPRADCRKANQPAPTHNPLAMRIWRECQRCPLKPLEVTK